MQDVTLLFKLLRTKIPENFKKWNRKRNKICSDYLLLLPKSDSLVIRRFQRNGIFHIRVSFGPTPLCITHRDTNTLIHFSLSHTATYIMHAMCSSASLLFSITQIFTFSKRLHVRPLVPHRQHHYSSLHYLTFNPFYYFFIKSQYQATPPK